MSSKPIHQFLNFRSYLNLDRFDFLGFFCFIPLINNIISTIITDNILLSQQCCIYKRYAITIIGKKEQTSGQFLGRTFNYRVFQFIHILMWQIPLCCFFFQSSHIETSFSKRISAFRRFFI